MFVIADIQSPILGADFLRHYSLLVDVRQHRLFDALTQLKVQGIVSQDSSPSPTFLPTKPNEYEAILADFPAVTRPCNNEQANITSLTT